MKTLIIEPVALTQEVGKRNEGFVVAAGNGHVEVLKRLFASRKIANQGPLEAGLADNIISLVFGMPNLTPVQQNDVVAVFIENQSANYRAELLNRDADFKLMRRLVASCKADVNINQQGWSALHSAYFREDGQEIFEFLLQHGANINICEQLTGAGTPIHIAIANENFASAKKMLELARKYKCHINYNARDNKGNKTILILATMVMSLEMVEEILKDGQNVNAADEQGRTALHIACALGQADIVQALIKAGANINQADVDGKTPFDYVKANEATVRKILKGISIDPDRDCGAIRNAFYIGNFNAIAKPLKELANVKCTVCLTSDTNPDTHAQILCTKENIDYIKSLYASAPATDKNKIILTEQIERLQGKTITVKCIEGQAAALQCLTQQQVKLKAQQLGQLVAGKSVSVDLSNWDCAALKNTFKKVTINPKFDGQLPVLAFKKSKK